MPQRSNKTWNRKLTIAMAQFNVKQETFLLYAVFRTQAHFTNIVHTNNDGTGVVNTTLCAVCS